MTIQSPGGGLSMSARTDHILLLLVLIGLQGGVGGFWPVGTKPF